MNSADKMLQMPTSSRMPSSRPSRTTRSSLPRRSKSSLPVLAMEKELHDGYGFWPSYIRMYLRPLSAPWTLVRTHHHHHHRHVPLFPHPRLPLPCQYMYPSHASRDSRYVYVDLTMPMVNVTRKSRPPAAHVECTSLPPCRSQFASSKSG